MNTLHDISRWKTPEQAETDRTPKNTDGQLLLHLMISFVLAVAVCGVFNIRGFWFIWIGLFVVECSVCVDEDVQKMDGDHA